MTKEIHNLADLLPDDRNANKGTPRGRGLVETSLQKYGAGRSILVDRNGKVIAGNKTSEAAAAAGIDDLIVVQSDGKRLVVVQRTDLDLDTDTAARELAIADNRAGELGLEWDADVLTELSQEIDLSTFWDRDEIAALLAQDTPDGGGGDEAPEVQDGPTRVQPGELWQLGRHRLLCGDSTKAEDVGRLMGGERAQGVITSPPYAEQREQEYGGVPVNQYVEWFKAVADNVKSHLSTDGSFFINIKPHSEEGERVLYVFDLVLAMRRSWGWRFEDEFCWTHGGTPKRVQRKFKNGFEPVYHFALSYDFKFRPDDVRHTSGNVPVWDASKGIKGAKKASKEQGSGNGFYSGFETDGLAYPSNVISARVDEATGHAAAFPVSLCDFFICAYSSVDDIWYEPFGGSGSTLIAADRRQRRAYCMELSPAYCDVILKRWEAETGQQAERIDG